MHGALRLRNPALSTAISLGVDVVSTIVSEFAGRSPHLLDAIPNPVASFR